MAGPMTPKEFAGYAALLEGSTLLQRAVEKNLLDQADITQVQFEIFMNLANQPNGLRMAELADRLIVSRSGLTYQVTRLEKSGHLIRERHGEDERGIVAKLTPSGDELRRRVLPGHLALVRESLFAVLEPDELDAMTSGLARVAAKLR